MGCQKRMQHLNQQKFDLLQQQSQKWTETFMALKESGDRCMNE